ncbi:uncharacterized protein A4U43_C02F3040 [Asparagus officinalis]|uniref:Fungal lipase-like domain-containing protein n=1 Tax=Asparagus officinalis TaxID=4686 RepID=A0A5P1FGA7_ASPOF|nr:uncharacterized protein A4U43_C02F3040 [Asparagus officinalis]
MLRIKAQEERPPEPIANERDVFSISGPTYLTSVDWTCPDHRRVIAAVLVKSVYLLEFDRQENRIGDEALAPPWWEFFHFNPVKLLVDDVDYSIFGAIFEFKPPTTPTEEPTVLSGNPRLDNAPKYIVAFRGTITTKDSRSRDISLDLSICQNGLHRTTRSALAIRAVKDVLSVTGVSSKVWLAGHSLGSSIATVAGKEMARSGDFLDTFLFNPPFFFAPIEKIRVEQIKTGIRIARSLIVAGASFAAKSLQRDKDSSFAKLSAWVPLIFAHPDDPICSGFIGYFKHRTKMEEMGAGAIERPVSGICFGARSGGSRIRCIFCHRRA